jgi:hypothetical protein
MVAAWSSLRVTGGRSAIFVSPCRVWRRSFLQPFWKVLCKPIKAQQTSMSDKHCHNRFPLSLIGRGPIVAILVAWPHSKATLRQAYAGRPQSSFWPPAGSIAPAERVVAGDAFAGKRCRSELSRRRRAGAAQYCADQYMQARGNTERPSGRAALVFPPQLDKESVEGNLDQQITAVLHNPGAQDKARAQMAQNQRVNGKSRD